MKKYIVLISVHGLIRGSDLELGRDADTGGQTKYVVDLAKALANNDNVSQVDLITRKVIDKNISKDYSKEIEILSDKARIIRIKAGPDEYIPKEQLWDHLDSFMDNLTTWFNGQSRMPDIVHSHYADAGYVGVRLANLLGVPLIHTGHSLGRDKRKRLLARGLSREEIEKTYNIERRIDAEEEILANADMVVTSTNNEIEEQYGLYNYYDPSCMSVIPPGTDLTLFHPSNVKEKSSIEEQLPKFLTNPDKPLILALSRPDERKNIHTLIEVFGESKILQQNSNLLIIAGSRNDIRDMESGSQSVLTNIMWLIDIYDLYGKVAIPKSHNADEVPKIYRLTTSTGGIFINPALTEPFGLTLLEASASGLPIVATENGGPVDIIKNCKNGILVDPLNKEQITEALEKLLLNKTLWLEFSKNGMEKVKKHYSWQTHVDSYLFKIKELHKKHKPMPTESIVSSKRYRSRAIFSDLDQSLIGNPKALALFSEFICENHKKVTFGIATGRRIDSALAVIKKYRIPKPDVLITSLGTRIFYGSHLTEDSVWTDHIDYNWNRTKIIRILSNTNGLKLQPKLEQSPFKISYYYDPELAPTIEDIVNQLRKQEVTANVMLSFGQFLDIVPSRASKGQALRYISQIFDIPLEKILVAGGSGTDEDIMRGNTLAVVVSNRHNEELSQLVDQEKIYFAKKDRAAGILEAIEH
ncbi:MAG: HAD-IIB family hydrolase, partial [Melioribacteraceae bacterium]|nr:HAD-IIB family hydrolase [Melioribacteraceae bacterium]